jgi:class 3 adenylate cyclase
MKGHLWAADIDPGGAALAIQPALRDHAWPDGATVRVRIGLHHGVPQMTDEGYVGIDVHRAARVGSAAHGGQIVLSESAREIVAARLPPQATMRRLGLVQLKGVPGHDTLWQLGAPDLPQDFPALRVETLVEDDSQGNR